MGSHKKLRAYPGMLLRTIVPGMYPGNFQRVGIPGRVHVSILCELIIKIKIILLCFKLLEIDKKWFFSEGKQKRATFQSTPPPCRSGGELKPQRGVTLIPFSSPALLSQYWSQACSHILNITVAFQVGVQRGSSSHWEWLHTMTFFDECLTRCRGARV